jgi:hypothetical protein
MRRLRRTGRILKWAGLVLSLAIISVWASSLLWNFGYSAIKNQRSFFSSITGGAVLHHSSPCRYNPGIARAFEFFKWRLEKRCTEPELIYLAPKCYLTSTYRNVCLPLWIPFLLIAVSTAILWWLDHRHIPVHCCQVCGYNLTGNVSSVCPECGTKTVIAIEKEHLA